MVSQSRYRFKNRVEEFSESHSGPHARGRAFEPKNHSNATASTPLQKRVSEIETPCQTQGIAAAGFISAHSGHGIEPN